jgi:hypothetical protein
LITRDGYTTLSGNKIPTRSGLDWLIVGGESGHHARPMHPAWARSLRDQCQAAAVPFFFKQWGEWLPIDQMKSCDHLYRSNRIAGPHQDQFAIDEDYGRTCIVPQLILRTDGQHKTLLDPLAFRSDLPGWPAMTAFKVGKKHAGRQLDGIEHNEVPA